MRLMYILFVSLLLVAIWNGEAHPIANLTECSKDYRRADLVSRSAESARRLLERFPSKVPTKDRLLIQILFTKGFESNSQKVRWLQCGLIKLQQNLMKHNTTADIFIWLHKKNADSSHVIPSWLTPVAFPRVNIMDLESETWKIPCGLIANQHWVARQHFNLGYYLMGRWRLTFSFDFAREMGYEYHLQFDDDSMLNNNVTYDMVAHLREKNALIAVHPDKLGEPRHLITGLPELTTYWLRVSGYKPQGDVFEQVLRGRSFDSDGFNLMTHLGFFIVIKVDWWFQDEVQDYLNAVLRQGQDIVGRWQEQAVINMMRLVFVPVAQKLVMEDVDIGHDKSNMKNFHSWCVSSGLLPQV